MQALNSHPFRESNPGGINYCDHIVKMRFYSLESAMSSNVRFYHSERNHTKTATNASLRVLSTPSRAKHASADTNYNPSGEKRKEKAPYLSLVFSFANAHPASLNSRRHITQMHVPHPSRIRIVLTELYIEKSSQCTYSAPSRTKHASSLPMPKNLTNF